MRCNLDSPLPEQLSVSCERSSPGLAWSSASTGSDWARPLSHLPNFPTPLVWQASPKLTTHRVLPSSRPLRCATPVDAPATNCSDSLDIALVELVSPIPTVEWHKGLRKRKAPVRRGQKTSKSGEDDDKSGGLSRRETHPGRARLPPTGRWRTATPLEHGFDMIA